MRVQVPRALGKLKKLHGSTPVEASEYSGWVASWALGGRPGSEPSERGHLDSGMPSVSGSYFIRGKIEIVLKRISFTALWDPGWDPGKEKRH